MPTAYKEVRQRSKSSVFRVVAARLSRPVHTETWVNAEQLSLAIGLSLSMIAEYTEKHMISHLPGSEPHYRVSQVMADLEAIEAQSLVLQPAFLKKPVQNPERASA